MPKTITASVLTKETGMTYRQLDYWCTQGLISPLGGNNPGSGYKREFDPENVEKIRFLVRLSTVFNRIDIEVLKLIASRYEEGEIELGDGITLFWEFSLPKENNVNS